MEVTRMQHTINSIQVNCRIPLFHGALRKKSPNLTSVSNEGDMVFWDWSPNHSGGVQRANVLETHCLGLNPSLATYLPTCVTLGDLLNFSVSQFVIYQMDNNSIAFIKIR